MSRSRDELWAKLLQAGLVEGIAPEPGEPPAPWFVKTLLAFSGWLAAVFLLGFIGVGFEDIVENLAARLAIGSAMIGGAFLLLRRRKNEFFEHLALAVSLAGQALVCWAIWETVEPNETLVWMLVALVQLLLALNMPNFVHRVFSSFVAAIALAGALDTVGAPYLWTGVLLFATVGLWLREFRFPKHLETTRAIGYGLVLALIPLQSMARNSSDGSARFAPDVEAWIQPWIGEVLSGAALLYLVWELLRRQGQPASGRIAIATLAGTLLLCAVSVEAPGITLGLAILLLGFAGSLRVLFGLGIVCLLFFVSSYYYSLEITLLAKAQALLLVGLVLLAMRWLMRRLLPGEEAPNA